RALRLLADRGEAMLLHDPFDGLEADARGRLGAKPWGFAGPGREAARWSSPRSRRRSGLDAVPDCRKSLRRKVFFAAPRAFTLRRGPVGDHRDVFQAGHDAYFTPRAPVPPSNAARRALSLIEPGQPVRRADVEPFPPLHLPAQPPRRDRALKQRQQRKLPGRASLEELRPIHADTGVGEAVALSLHDEVRLEPEVTARVMRRIRSQQQARVGAFLQSQDAAEIHVGPDIGIDHEEGLRSEERQGAMNT